MIIVSQCSEGQPGLEVPYYSAPEVSFATGPEVVEAGADESKELSTISKLKWRRLGFQQSFQARQKSFWILFTFLSTFIIGAAVGGGIGGASAIKNSSEDK